MNLRRQRELDERIVRIRAMISTSQASIARSEERIGNSMRLLAQSRKGFGTQDAELTDEELIGAARHRRKHEQQSEIDEEVALTVEGQPGPTRL